MIWALSFLSFLIYSLKDFFFMNWFFFFDQSSMFMVSIIPLVLYLIGVMTFVYFSNLDYLSYLSFYFFISFFLMVCFFSDNLFIFLLSLEFCVWPMFYLIYDFSKDSDKISALLFMFLINIFGSVPFMIFSSKFFLVTDFGSSFQSFFILSSCSMVLVSFFLLVLLCKLPIFLSHFWLTKAHVSASGSCSMILASLMLKLGSYGLFKFSFIFLSSIKNFMTSSLSLSIIGSLIICIVMIRFFDMKHLIACSSILHMALIFPACVFCKGVGVLGSLFMMVGHGLVSLILFYLVTIFYELSHNRSYDSNKTSESILSSVSLMLMVFVFLNLGVPPFINFFSEVYIVSMLFIYSFSSLVGFCLVMLVSIMFTMFFSSKIMFGKKNKMVKSDVNSTPIFFMVEYFIFLFLTIYLI